MTDAPTPQLDFADFLGRIKQGTAAVKDGAPMPPLRTGSTTSETTDVTAISEDVAGLHRALASKLGVLADLIEHVMTTSRRSIEEQAAVLASSQRELREEIRQLQADVAGLAARLDERLDPGSSLSELLAGFGRAQELSFSGTVDTLSERVEAHLAVQTRELTAALKAIARRLPPREPTSSTQQP